MRAYRLAILLVPALGGACGSILGGTDCSTEARPAIRLEVLDSVTRAPAGGEAARIIARDGAYADTARTVLPDSAGEARFASLARERAGTYEVTVERAGYQLWRGTGVRVSRDECHVRTAQLTALLQALP